MPLKLFALDTAVIGNLNPFIITPEWLAKQEILPSNQKQQVTASFEFPDRSISFRFKIDDLSWDINFSRCVVSAEKVIDTSKTIVKIFRKLPHTPVKAVGNNFHYRREGLDWNGRVPRLGELDFDSLKEHGNVQSVKW